MVWQFYWPNWWKVWPSFTKQKLEYCGILCAGFTFSFGAFQARGYR